MSIAQDPVYIKFYSEIEKWLNTRDSDSNAYDHYSGSLNFKFEDWMFDSLAKLMPKYDLSKIERANREASGYIDYHITFAVLLTDLYYEILKENKNGN